MLHAAVLSWDDICCTIRVARGTQERRILSNVSGIAGPPPDEIGGGSCLFAILGPSGAGKTTLIDILAGRRSSEGGPCEAAPRVGVCGRTDPQRLPTGVLRGDCQAVWDEAACMVQLMCNTLEGA